MTPSIAQPIAIISSLSGLNGEVRLKPLSRYFEDHIMSKYFMVGYSKSNLKNIVLDIVKGKGKKRIFKFKGVNTVIEANLIKGKTLFKEVSKDDKLNLVSEDLIGWSIKNELNEKIGELVNIMWLPSNDIYIIKNGEKEYLIPVIDEVIKQLNYEKEEILINPIDGLID